MSAIIRIEGLTKSFGAKNVLQGIDLEVPPGQIIGYIGPNGAGKSTTVKILCGMLDDFGGRVSVCGQDVATAPVEVKKHIGYVPESAAVYEALSPRQFLRFLGQLHEIDDAEIERRSVELLDLFGLAEELDQPLGSFSKGMRQKVLITAALLHNPDVIFLDEPLSGLDANSVVIVKEILLRLAERGKTIFYCSHVMDVVERVCHRIVIIDDGHVVADGAFRDLQSMSKGASLERIFTQLTGAVGHEELAGRFVDVLDGHRS